MRARALTDADLPRHPRGRVAPRGNDAAGPRSGALQPRPSGSTAVPCRWLRPGSGRGRSLPGGGGSHRRPDRRRATDRTFVEKPCRHRTLSPRTLDGDAIPRASSRPNGLELGEVDLRVRDVVHEIGQEELRRQGDDLDDLPVGEPGLAHRREFRIAHPAARLDQALGEARRGPPLRVARTSLAVEGDLLGRFVGEAGGAVGVGREAVIAGVRLGYRQRDGVAGPEVEGLAQRPLESDETGKGGGAQRHEPVEVRDEPELHAHRVEDGLRLGGGLVAGRDCDSWHVEVLLQLGYALESFRRKRTGVPPAVDEVVGTEAPHEIEVPRRRATWAANPPTRADSPAAIVARSTSSGRTPTHEPERRRR